MFPRSLTYHDNKSFFLFGPRGVGKTGWLRRTFPNELYFDLLEARTYSQLLADPTRLAERIPHDYSGWVILVEVQRIPELLNEVRRLIESRRLRFIMKCSSARALHRKGVNLLAGRALTRFMHPLTIKEHLLVSKVLPIFRASHYFCACSDLSLLCEAYDFSSHPEV